MSDIKTTLTVISKNCLNLLEYMDEQGIEADEALDYMADSNVSLYLIKIQLASDEGAKETNRLYLRQAQVMLDALAQRLA